jgi:hypothetical protein
MILWRMYNIINISKVNKTILISKQKTAPCGAAPADIAGFLLFFPVDAHGFLGDLL